MLWIDMLEEEKAMLDYAVKLTEDLAAVQKEDLDKLRYFDLSDRVKVCSQTSCPCPEEGQRDILDLNQVCCLLQLC